MLWKLYSIKLAPDVQESIELVAIFLAAKFTEFAQIAQFQGGLQPCSVTGWFVLK
jgi:hypothetical protein